jgi:hypothetical protein
MKLVLTVIALSTLSLPAYGSESNQAPTFSLNFETSTTIHNTKGDAEPATVVASAIPLADKILAEEAEMNTRIVNDSLRGTSSPTDRVRAVATSDALVSKWLEEHADHADEIAAFKKASGVAKAHSHVHYQDIAADMGGGWCDLCGCWMRHGLDPNGTPQSEIGHQNVCSGGASTQNCWQHYYRYCWSS